MSRSERRDALLELAEACGCGGVVLRRPANVAWYTGGLDNRIDHDDEGGVASIAVTSDGEWIVTDVIEAERLRALASEFEVVDHPWTEAPTATLDRLADGRRLATDLAASAKELDLAADLAPLRYVLDDEAIAQYRRLGADTRAVFDEVAAAVIPEMSEFEAAGALSAAARRRGANTPVVLVAGAARIARYRHPLPTRASLGTRVMLVACVERHGLFASLTRFVDFDEPSADLVARTRVTDEILLRMRTEATRPGRTLGEAFDDCRRFYAEVGLPDEWRRHHQGGLSGYRSREVIARPGDDTEIRPGQAFAWNPSITGTKSEETFVVIYDGTEVLT